LFIFLFLMVEFFPVVSICVLVVDDLVLANFLSWVVTAWFCSLIHSYIQSKDLVDFSFVAPLDHRF
jgi:hypothetical protein